jgi:hypothetical protein
MMMRTETHANIEKDRLDPGRRMSADRREETDMDSAIRKRAREMKSGAVTTTGREKSEGGHLLFGAGTAAGGPLLQNGTGDVEENKVLPPTRGVLIPIEASDAGGMISQRNPITIDGGTHPACRAPNMSLHHLKMAEVNTWIHQNCESRSVDPPVPPPPSLHPPLIP